MTYRIGVIGCGWIAPYQIEGWRQVAGAEIAGVCDRDAERAADLSRRFGIGWYGDDPLCMMDTLGLQIVDIATTPESHKALTLAAVDRGLHVLCQKPAAPSIADAEEMIAAAHSRGVVLYINEMLRFCAWFMKARELIHQGAIGNVVYARLYCRSANFLEVGPERRVTYGFRDFLKGDGGTIILEETIHYFDVARYLFGDPGSIYAAVQRVSPVRNADDSVSAVLRYSDKIVMVENSWAAHGPERLGMEIEGTGGAIFMSADKKLQLYSARAGRIEDFWYFNTAPWSEERARVFAALFRDFLSLLPGSGGRTAQAADNLRTLRLTLAACESAKSRAEVLL